MGSQRLLTPALSRSTTPVRTDYPTSRTEHGIHDCRGIPMHSRDQMRVGVEGQDDGGVSERGVPLSPVPLMNNPGSSAFQYPMRLMSE